MTTRIDLPRPDYTAMQGFVSGMFKTLGAPPATRPCPTCTTPMVYEPASRDEHPDGRVLRTFAACWTCPECDHCQEVDSVPADAEP